MGNFTIEKWRCDRCGAVQDERPSRPAETYTLRATVDYSFSGGPQITWLDMCASCNDAVGKAIDDLKKAVKMSV